MSLLPMLRSVRPRRRVVEKWTMRQVHDVTNARYAARRAWFFVRQLEPLPSADDRERLLRFILEQVQRELGGRALSAPVDGGPTEYSGARRPFAELDRQWRRLQRIAGPVPAARADRGKEEADADRKRLRRRVHKLDRRIRRFLQDSEPAAFAIRFTYSRIPMLLLLARLHAGHIVATTAAISIAIGVEAVRSLLLNQSWFALAVLPVPLPAFVLFAIPYIMRKHHRMPFWDRGGRVFRTLRGVVVPPPAWVPRHPDGAAVNTLQRGMLMKVALYLVLWIVFGLAYHLGVLAGILDPVGLTVYMIAVLLALLILAGWVVDFADMHLQAPVRLFLLVATAIVAFGILRTDSWFVLAGLVILAVALLVVWSIKVRYAAAAWVPGAFAVIVLTVLLSTAYRHDGDAWRGDAAGVATPAIVPAGLWPHGGDTGPPVVAIAASGGGSRAAIFAALALEAMERELPTVARHVQAISSVSGGSLTNAAYVVRRLARNHGGVASAPACEAHLVDRAAQDFLRPTLLGVVLANGRGRGIERAWRECPVGLGDVSIHDLAAAWIAAASDSAPPFPLPIFNSVTLERHAVVITPLDGSVFRAHPMLRTAWEPNRPHGSASAGTSPATWVHYRSGIYDLRDLAPGFDPTLPQAVRASANFPFGFPLVEIRTNESLPFSPRPSDWDTTAKVIRLTDGGALSNSGMWSLFHLLHERRAALRQRGLVLVMIDASRMPSFPTAPNRQLDLLGTIMDKNPKGEHLHQRMLGQLAQDFGSCFAALHVALPASEEFNIHTTWALDIATQRLLERAFSQVWQADALGTAWSRVMAEAKRGCEEGLPFSWPARLPLS